MTSDRAAAGSSSARPDKGPSNQRELAQAARLSAAFGSSCVGTAVVQRSVITAGGSWDTSTYQAWGPASPELGAPMGIGAEIALSFTPGRGSPIGRKIGLIQSVKAQYNQKADPTGDEAVAPDEQGLTIDRSKGMHNERTTSPVYGAFNDQDRQAQSLTESLPKDAENAWGRRNRFLKNEPARLWDKPSSDVRGGETLKLFETAAVVLEGAETGQYLGTVAWGYHRAKGQKGAPDLAPAALTKVSDGNPSQEFRTAARHWNEAPANADGNALVPVPLPQEDAL